MNTKSILCALLVAGISLPLMAQENAAPAEAKAEATAQAAPTAPATFTVNPEFVHKINFKADPVVEVEIIEASAPGTTLKKGDALLKLKTEPLSEALEDQEMAFESAKLAHERFLISQAQAKVNEAKKLEKSERMAKRTEEDLNDFEKDFMPQQINENKLSVWRAENNLLYQQENLRQLERMYKEDQITEESEEIILIRTRNEVKAAEDSLAGIKITSNWVATRRIPRELEDKKSAVEQAKIELNNLKELQAIWMKEEIQGLKGAQKKLQKSEEALNKTKKNLENAQCLSPVDGILLSAQKGAKWGNASFIILNADSTLKAQKSKGSTLNVGDMVTVVPNTPQGKVTAIDGDTVTISYQDSFKK